MLALRCFFVSRRRFRGDFKRGKRAGERGEKGTEGGRQGKTKRNEETESTFPWKVFFFRSLARRKRKREATSSLVRFARSKGTKR
jgi:hypothetical protein